jgi:hypothetical protein
MSYRDSFCLLNRIWNLPEADMLKERTLWDRIDAEGIRAIKAVDNGGYCITPWQGEENRVR